MAVSEAENGVALLCSRPERCPDERSDHSLERPLKTVFERDVQIGLCPTLLLRGQVLSFEEIIIQETVC